MRDYPPQQNRPATDLSDPSITVRFFVGAQVIATVLAVVRNEEFGAEAWNDFLVLTVFIQTVSLLGIIAMKIIASFSGKLSVVIKTSIAFAVLLLITAGVYEGLLLVLHALEITPERWPLNHATTLARVLIIAALVIAMVVRYMFVYQRARSRSESQQQDRLQALQSRIRPHFLFNSMNSVASLIRSDPDLAEKALQDLADVFRVLLADARKMVPITAEGELARQYLDIEKLRLGERLQVKWTASNVPRSALIPSLTLQPLLENAVYHGIEPSFAGGTVDIQLWSDGDELRIMISNPVPEVADASKAKRGNRIAMENVRERLSRHFGGRATLQNMEQQGNYYVKISMPIIRG